MDAHVNEDEVESTFRERYLLYGEDIGLPDKTTIEIRRTEEDYQVQVEGLTSMPDWLRDVIVAAIREKADALVDNYGVRVPWE